jgi:hypothetical protein
VLQYNDRYAIFNYQYETIDNEKKKATTVE